MCGDEEYKSFPEFVVKTEKILGGRKKNENKEDETFFRSEDEIKEEVKNSAVQRIYIGNLKKEKNFEVLKKDCLCMTDSDTNGNLKKKTKENIVFVKLIKCETEKGQKQHLAVCLKCNPKEKSEALQKVIGRKVKVTTKFKEENIKSCIHSNVSETLYKKEESKAANESTSNCKVLEDDEKQHLAVAFDGETHGLVFVNKARKATKGNCQKCKSVQCSHVRIWDKEHKKDIFGTQEKKETEECYDEDYEDEDESVEAMKSNHKLKYPFDKATHEQMRKNDSVNYNNLINLTSKPKENVTCPHGNKWNENDPVENEWVYSRKVKIAHSSYVEQKERTVFYRSVLRKNPLDPFYTKCH